MNTSHVTPAPVAIRRNPGANAQASHGTAGYEATESRLGDAVTESMPGNEANGRMPADREQHATLEHPAGAPSRDRDQPGPGTRIGQYELIRLLGRGGMGEVHLARDLRLGRLVAIKLLAERGARAERFLTEARATARCNHENIVIIHEVSEHDGRAHMVLEYLEGHTLRHWLHEHAERATASRQHPAISPGLALEMMLPVVRALAYAHECGIVHRDLKPENIMLTRSGSVKVLDFGLAKILPMPEPSQDRAANRATALVTGSSNQFAGTLPYMSPEQMKTAAIDHRSDLWAVGIMLFEMVTGQHPVPWRHADDLFGIADHEVPMPSVREHLPDIGRLGDVIDRCLVKSVEQRIGSARELLAELEALAPGRRAALVGNNGSPFAGLAAFQEGDADNFFGRDRDIDQVVTELRNRPLVALVGPSGTGKSSLVRAGVIPALKRSGEGWDTHVLRPGREPLAALAAIPDVLGRVQDPSDSMRRLRAEPGYLGARLRAHATTKPRRILVFVDQLEELYTLGASPDERAAFLAALTAVADDAAAPLRVVVAMRSDFIDRLAEDRRFGAEVTRGLVLLPPMGRDGMREALLRPVESAEHRFETPALVDRMVNDLVVTPGALPLLQFTAARLWELRDAGRRMLTEASYERLGGVAGALATHADAVLAGMSSAQQAVARAVLERLVTPERTRALVSMAELHELHRDADAVDHVVQYLATMRLLVIERGAEGAEHIVELVHESLIDRWPTLARWLDENQDDAAMLARLRSAARDWERSNRAAGLLWTGKAAREAGAWQQRYKGELTPVEQRYLAAVLAATERTRRVRRRLFGGILMTAVVVAIVMAWLAWAQARARQAAAGEAARARDATRMAEMRALPEDPTTQLALLREIEDTRVPPSGAVQEIRRLLQAGVALAVLTGHEDLVWSVAFSPDGQRIASASRDKTVWVWEADGRGELRVLRGHDDGVVSVAFSPDSQRIVSASWDKTVRVWNADGSGEPLILRGHDEYVDSAAFSPDGRRIVSASRDKTVRVWNADGSGEPLVLRGHDKRVVSAVFSPNDGGQRIVSASEDKTVRVWNADGNGEPLVRRGHDDGVMSAEFSPDGHRIVSASRDKTVRVWSADRGGEPLVLRGHGDWVWSAAFSPDDDGQRIVSASRDRTVRVWNADGSGERLVLRGHDEGVWSAELSPDGRRIVSASEDKTVRVWNADGSGKPLIMRGHDGIVYAAAFSPDDNGQRIVSASKDKTVRVWNADGSGEPLVLRGHDEAVWSAAFSRDGRRIVSASFDKTVRVWSADGSGEPLVLRGHEEAVLSAAFSPDGRRIVSASFDKTVRVWSADGSGEPVILRGHDDRVTGAEFSPDGQHIVSASKDKTIRIWRADGTGEPVILVGHDLWVNKARFSPDGRRIVSASDDHTVRVWHDLTPATLDDSRLWTATTYCMPIERRIELLGVTEERAGRDLSRCLQRVEQARRASASHPNP